MSRSTAPSGASSVRRRLTVFTLVMSALLLVVTAVSLTGVSVQRRQADLLVLSFGPTIDSSRTIRETMNTAQSSLRGYMIINRSGVSQATGDARTMLRDYQLAQGRIQTELGDLDQALAKVDFSGSDVERGQVLAMAGRQRDAVEAWWAYARADQLKTIPSAEELERGDRLFGSFRQASDELLSELASQRAKVRVTLRAGGARAEQAIIVATVLALLLALFAGWRTTVAMTVPLRRLRNVVHRQRNGDRTAWARTDIGAAEVRTLAADINTLTAAQITLLDQQTYSLALQRAAVEIGRRIQDAGDLAEAFTVVTQGIARALQVDRAAAGVVGTDERLGDVVIYTADGLLGNDDVPATVPFDVGRLAVRLWHGERKFVIDDVTGPRMDALGWAEPTRQMQPTGGLVVVSFGLTEHTIGAITVRSMSEPRTWVSIEVAFIEQVAAKLARGLATAQTERDRQDYIRRLEELDEHKDTFMSTVSHELRTPLASIVGYLEMLEDGDAGELSPIQRQMLDVVGRNAVRLRGLIEDLLVLNRMETTTLSSTDGEVVDLDALLAHVVEELLPAAAQGGVALVPAITTAPGRVRGDRGQLGRALTNIVSNAVKFTPQGGTVRLWCQPGDDSGTVEIVCTDTGIGIPEDEQANLFTRFYRASNVTSAQIPGTGIGLVIVRSIVERHGGALELHSQEHQGTTVRMVLPLVSTANAVPGLPTIFAGGSRR